MKNNRYFKLLMLLVIALQFTGSILCGQELPSVPSGHHSVEKRPWAVKTNLLFDAATILNIEVEALLYDDFSLAGELILPWWLYESKQHALQIRAFNLEGRYWFRQQGNLNGWFAGWHAGIGLYDLEWNRKGYQGEYYLATGVVGGYSAPIGRNFNLEFTLGVGYFNSDYRRYNALQSYDGEWYLIKQHEGSFKWLGPTRAKISLVWFPRFKKKGGRR